MSRHAMYSKRAPRRHTLNVLVCGASGTGKSSFINTLVGHRVLFESESTPAAEFASMLVFQPTTVELDEPLSDGSKLVLTLVETEGFGTGLDHSNDVEQVANYIECRFDEVLAEESRIRRNPRFKDDRLDCCLYFIEPTGHGLRELDIMLLQRLSSVVNVIPVLARADALTPSERVLNKRLVAEDIRFHDIQIFDFQYSDDAANHQVQHHSKGVDGYVDNDNEVDSENAALLNDAVPLAITSTNLYDDHGESQYARKLPFGTVQILDPEHSDFQLLRDALFSGFFTELKERTHDVLYETYRTHRLDPQQNHRASLLLPQELADHAAKLKQAQMERETRMLREREMRVNAEIEAKRAMLLKREQELRELEAKMAEQQTQSQAHGLYQDQQYQDQQYQDQQYQNQQYQDQQEQPDHEQSYQPRLLHQEQPHTGQHPDQRADHSYADQPYQEPPHNKSYDQSYDQPSKSVEKIPYEELQTQYLETITEISKPGATTVQATVEEVPPSTSASNGATVSKVPAAPAAPATAQAPTPIPDEERRVRQRRSKQELREHTQQLHAELGDLEAQREEIQNQAANVGRLSMHEQLDSTSPLIIKKTAAT